MITKFYISLIILHCLISLQNSLSQNIKLKERYIKSFKSNSNDSLYNYFWVSNNRGRFKAKKQLQITENKSKFNLSINPTNNEIVNFEPVKIVEQTKNIVEISAGLNKKQFLKQADLKKYPLKKIKQLNELIRNDKTIVWDSFDGCETTADEINWKYNAFKFYRIIALPFSNDTTTCYYCSDIGKVCLIQHVALVVVQSENDQIYVIDRTMRFKNIRNLKFENWISKLINYKKDCENIKFYDANCKLSIRTDDGKLILSCID